MIDRKGKPGGNRRTSRRGFLKATSAAAAALFLKGCGWSDDNPSSSKFAPAADRPLKGGTDVTFFIAADTHLGYKNIAEANARQVEAMNNLPGTPLPPGIGGEVQRPRGVLIAGDLTESGRSSEWKQFVEYYGLNGGDGRLLYPIFECTGNHDRDQILFRPVLDGVRRRHGSLTYSWDWGDLHLACLDCYPDAANLRWLKRDLAAVGHKVPVVVYFHYPIDGPYSEWWSDKEKEAFRQALEGYNVVAIFHGHYHASLAYEWKSYHVFNVGSPRHGGHSFAVARVTDTTMSVTSWDWGQNRWRWAYHKAINSASPSEAASASGA